MNREDAKSAKGVATAKAFLGQPYWVAVVFSWRAGPTHDEFKHRIRGGFHYQRRIYGVRD